MSIPEKKGPGRPPNPKPAALKDPSLQALQDRAEKAAELKLEGIRKRGKAATSVQMFGGYRDPTVQLIERYMDGKLNPRGYWTGPKDFTYDPATGNCRAPNGTKPPEVHPTLQKQSEMKQKMMEGWKVAVTEERDPVYWNEMVLMHEPYEIHVAERAHTGHLSSARVVNLEEGDEGPTIDDGQPSADLARAAADKGLDAFSDAERPAVPE